MSGCEKCWSEATRRAFLTGTSVVDQYPQVLAENDANPEHAEPRIRPADQTEGDPR